jgi:hypothetical protein
MKTFSFPLIVIYSVGVLFFTQACDPKTASSEHTTVAEASVDGATKPTYETPASFQAQFKEAWKAYLAIKDAFVLSNTEQTSEKANTFVNVLHQADTTLLEVATRKVWTERESKLATKALAIKAGKTIDEQRVAFESLSEEMYQLVQEVGASGTTVYKQYCPMAFDNKGAFWLSADKEIKNPYFGDAMLECGSVQEELSFK